MGYINKKTEALHNGNRALPEKKETFSSLFTHHFHIAMASLTPGVLSKLLQNAGNRVTGEHRQALLQVTEIIPRLSEDTWQPNTGYFLKLSDSLHSAYVSVSDSDAELIRSDKLQLGQFVYVTRFDSDDSSSPVPLVCGLNPLPKRRPCVGNPTDLVSSDSLSFLTTSKPNSNVKKKKMNKGSVSGSVLRSHSNGNKKNNVVVGMRRLSLDSSTRRVWDHSVVSKTKPPSPSSSSRFKFNKSTSTSPNVLSSPSFGFTFFFIFCSLKMKSLFWIMLMILILNEGPITFYNAFMSLELDPSTRELFVFQAHKNL